MRALVYRGPWQARVEDYPAPRRPGPQQVLCRIEATGICGTDLGILGGLYDASVPVVLGHESSGVVEEIGANVTAVSPGDHIVIDPTYYCGQCRMCRSNRSSHCQLKFGTEAGVSADGTFAQLYLTEDRFVYKLKPDVSFEEATLIEPLSCALTGSSRLRLGSMLTALVLGAGPMGILYACLLDLRGMAGVVVETSAYRRDLVRAILSKRWLVLDSLESGQFPFDDSENRVDVVVDTTSTGLAAALPMLCAGGQALVVGLHRGSLTFDPAKLADQSWSILGSIDSIGTFGEACQMVCNGVIPATRIITHTIPLSAIEEGWNLLGYDVGRRSVGAAKAAKVVVRPQA